ncbi:hypothetical protein [Dolichospermum phage Dfl-JY23]
MIRIDGELYSDNQVNRLLQIQHFPIINMEKLLTKPDKYYEVLKGKPEAVKKLSRIVKSPLPVNFLTGKCKEYDFFKNRATKQQQIQMINHRMKVLRLIMNLISKLSIPLSESEETIIKGLTQ